MSSSSAYVDMSLEEFAQVDDTLVEAWAGDVYGEYVDVAQRHRVSLSAMVGLYDTCRVWDADMAAYVLMHEQSGVLQEVLAEEVYVDGLLVVAGYALSNGDIRHDEVERRLESGLWDYEMAAREERVLSLVSPDYDSSLSRDIQSVYWRIVNDSDALAVVFSALDNEEYELLERLGLTYDEDVCPIAPYAEVSGELVAGDATHVIHYVCGLGKPDGEPMLALHTTDKPMVELHATGVQY